MDQPNIEVVEVVSKAFESAKGPAAFRFPETGWWYEMEGRTIAKALLHLDSEDLEYRDIIREMDGSFLPAWTTGEGLLWLLPGILRVCFESAPKDGDDLLQRLFTELHERITKGDITLTSAQSRSLLLAHEVFYCAEEFAWNPDNHSHPLCDLLKQSSQS